MKTPNISTLTGLSVLAIIHTFTNSLSKYGIKDILIYQLTANGADHIGGSPRRLCRVREPHPAAKRVLGQNSRIDGLSCGHNDAVVSVVVLAVCAVTAAH